MGTVVFLHFLDTLPRILRLQISFPLCHCVLAATFFLLGLTCHVGRTAEVSGMSVEDPSRPSSLEVTIPCNPFPPSVVSALTSASSPPPSFSTVLCATMAELPWSPERVWRTHTSVYRLYLPYTDFASASLFTSLPSWLSPSTVSSLPPSFSSVLRATLAELPRSPERVWRTPVGLLLFRSPSCAILLFRPSYRL